jgi:predicted RNA-binding protein
MCESTAYILKEGQEKIVLENVDFLENGDEQVKLVDLFGEEKILRARVKTLSLVDHKIVLEPL